MIIELETGHKLEVPDGSTPDQINDVVDHFSQTQLGKGEKSLSENTESINQQPQEDVGYLQTFADQALQGATFGWGDEIADRAGAFIASKGLGIPYDEALKIARDASKARMAAEWDQHPVASLASNIAGGISTGGLGASTKAGAAVARGLRSGNAAARIGKGFVSGAASGAAFGSGTADDGKAGEGAIKGAVVGGLTGGAVPAIGAAGAGIKSTVVPKIEEATAKLAKRAEDFGIPLRLDQISPTRVRKTIQKVSQEVPFSGVEGFENKQVIAWNKAVAKTIGQDAENLSPEVIQAFRADNSAKFDGAFAGENFKFTNMVKKDLMGISKDASETLDEGLAKVVQNNVDSVWNQLKSGSISGEKLASIRSELLRKMTKGGNQASGYLGDIVGKLDEIASAQLPKAKAEMLAEARRQYRNFKTIQPLLEKSTDGTINPTQLLNRVSANKYIDASKIAVGEDDIVDLARIGKQFMAKAGGSDTTQKLIAAGGIGSVGTMLLTNPLAALAVIPKAAAGVAANRYILQGANQSQRFVKKAVQKSQNSGQLNAISPLAQLAATSVQNAAQQAPLKITIRPRKN